MGGRGLYNGYYMPENIEISIQREIDNIIKEEDSIPTPRSSIEFAEMIKSMQFPFLLDKLLQNRHIDNNDCYKFMKISKATYYKSVRSNPVPSKKHIFRLALGLELHSSEADILLNSAGYLFSNSIKEDIIVKNALDRGLYDIDKVNELIKTICPESKGI